MRTASRAAAPLSSAGLSWCVACGRHRASSSDSVSRSVTATAAMSSPMLSPPSSSSSAGHSGCSCARKAATFVGWPARARRTAAQRNTACHTSSGAQGRAASCPPGEARLAGLSEAAAGEAGTQGAALLPKPSEAGLDEPKVLGAA
jgi:hypothetical protein